MIVNGVLEKMSSGDESSTGMVKREYITVNGKRIRNVVSTSFIDEVLTESLGKEISLSLKKSVLGKMVMAFKDDDGEIHKMSIGYIIMLTILKIFLIFMLAIMVAIPLLNKRVYLRT